MLVFVPVSRYRIAYHVAVGRPYSFFEELVLQAIVEGAGTIAELQTTFAVHRRPLIEGVVTLVQAGWVGLDVATHALVPTLDGIRAAKAEGGIPRNITIEERRTFLVGERVTGQLARSADVTFASKSELQSVATRSGVLRKEAVPHPSQASIVTPFIDRLENEWFRSLGNVDIVRDGADFVVVDADPVSGSIIGLPSDWRPGLGPLILEEARRREIELTQEDIVPARAQDAISFIRDYSEPSSLRDIEDSALLDWTQDRLVIGSEAHQLLLRDRIQTARSYLCIVCPRVDDLTISLLEDDLREAAERGVLIDIVWGRVPDHQDIESHHRAIDGLRSVVSDVRIGSRGRLNVAARPSRSEARILLCDTERGFEAVIGAFDWLADQRAPGLQASVILDEANLVSRVCLVLSDLLAADEQLGQGSGVTRLRNVAADLDRTSQEQRARIKEPRDPLVGGEDFGHQRREAPTYQGEVSCKLVVGHEHGPTLSRVILEAQNEIVVFCKTGLDPHSPTSMAIRSRMMLGLDRVRIYRSDTDARGVEPELEPGAGSLERFGATMETIPGLSCEVVVVDGAVALITSLSLGRPPNAGPTTLGDVGIVVWGKRVVPNILEGLGGKDYAPRSPPSALYLTSFKIEGVRSIASLRWSLEGIRAPGWHVLVGDNGSGKSTLLRAIALSIMGADAAGVLYATYDLGSWVRHSSSDAVVALELSPENTAPTSSDRAILLRELRWSRSRAPESESTDGEDLPFLAAYGPFRRISGGDTEHPAYSDPILLRSATLFDERIALADGLRWLRGLHVSRLERDQDAMWLFERVRGLVNTPGFLPSGMKLASVTSQVVMFEDADANQVRVEELSDGFRSVLAVTFDLVRNLVSHFGARALFDARLPDIVVAPGIVLIDEVDAHLHPSWQQEVGQWFVRHFPAIQFIVSTHSALICQAAEFGTVFRLGEPGETNGGEMLHGTTRNRLIYGNALEAYGSGAFGDEISRSKSARALLQRLAALNGKELSLGLSPEEREEQEVLRAAFPTRSQADAYDFAK